MLKVGLLGLGNIGMVHYNNGYENITDLVKVDACFDMIEDNLKKIEGVRTYTDVDAFLKGEQGKLDFIDICLPTFLHKEVTIKALEMGFNVLCEKPMALTPEDADEMCAKAKETGKLLMIAHPLRFHPYYMLINDYIKNEPMGRLKNISYAGYTTGLPQGTNNWFKNIALSGGPLLDGHVHDVDMLLWFLGKPVAQSSIGNEPNDSGYYAVSTNLTYEKDVFVNFQCDYDLVANMHQNGRALRLNFENGYIIQQNGMFIEVNKDGEITDLEELNDLRGQVQAHDMFKEEIIYFANCVKENKWPEKCPPEDSALAIKIIDNEMISAGNQGKIINL